MGFLKSLRKNLNLNMNTLEQRIPLIAPLRKLLLDQVDKLPVDLLGVPLNKLPVVRVDLLGVPLNKLPVVPVDLLGVPLNKLPGELLGVPLKKLPVDLLGVPLNKLPGELLGVPLSKLQLELIRNCLTEFQEKLKKLKIKLSGAIWQGTLLKPSILAKVNANSIVLRVNQIFQTQPQLNAMKVN